MLIVVCVCVFLPFDLRRINFIYTILHYYYYYYYYYYYQCLSCIA